MDTRVFLAGLPRLAGEIVRTAVARRPGVAVVGELSDTPERTMAEIEQTGASVVVLSTAQPSFGETLGFLLAHRPPLRLLLLAQDGRESYDCRPVGELSPQSLLDTMLSE